VTKTNGKDLQRRAWATFIDKLKRRTERRRSRSRPLMDNDVAIGAMTVSLDLDKVPMK
jgi:hypothetical protein